MTTVAKALGGPVKATVLLGTAAAIGGYGVLRGAEAGVKNLVKVIRKRSEAHPLRGQIFKVTSAGEDDGSGLKLAAGSEFRVVEGDGDAILIEVFGRDDNPHFVSGAS